MQTLSEFEISVLENLALILPLPEKVDDDKIFPDQTRKYSPEELAALLHLYGKYRDMTELEILHKYVDYALDLIKDSPRLPAMTRLITEVADLGRKGIIHTPAWIHKALEEAVTRDTGNPTELVEPLLLLYLVNNDKAAQRKARQIINSCYRAALESETELNGRIDCLHIAVTCCDYVSRFNVRKAGEAWNDISRRIFAESCNLSADKIFNLLEAANELADYTPIPSDARQKLKNRLKEMATPYSIAACAYSRYGALYL